MSIRRPAALAGRFLFGVVRICWGVICFLFWGLIILTIPFARLLILLPLSFTIIGSAGAAVFFAWQGAWADAGSAALISFVAALLFGGYSYCAEKMDPTVGMMPPFAFWRSDWRYD
ncbi:hypothetical protein D8W47_24985 [Salmonella enterica]|nr:MULTISPECIES: hypothetical protein [Pseudomonadota]EAB1567113.1 hypothetical protein [Salmonella enterica]ECE0326004.1 hypothetical protein [Salmonella enterica subsp. enterica]ELK6626048.1 hypothetical protein [Citrobacter amalonaticus]HCJ7377291.1 hypothetical protein [Enterobacter hormaechei subsp. xiangfangensis]EAB1716137.1 hypothetical protein [Salmonella enterica]